MARAEEAALTADIVELATRYGRYGYRRITALLHRAGWVVNMKRVERIWRREGLKVPYRQPKKGRLWLNDGSCIRLRPEYPNHVWSYDFVEDRTHNGRRFRMLNVIDEFTRECLASRVRFELFGRRFTLRLKVVRVVGIEPTLLSEPDFESGASTSSTTGAREPSFSRTGRLLPIVRDWPQAGAPEFCGRPLGFYCGVTPLPRQT